MGALYALTPHQPTAPETNRRPSGPLRNNNRPEYAQPQSAETQRSTRTPAERATIGNGEACRQRPPSTASTTKLRPLAKEGGFSLGRGRVDRTPRHRSTSTRPAEAERGKVPTRYRAESSRYRTNVPVLYSETRTGASPGRVAAHTSIPHPRMVRSWATVATRQVPPIPLQATTFQRTNGFHQVTVGLSHASSARGPAPPPTKYHATPACHCKGKHSTRRTKMPPRNKLLNQRPRGGDTSLARTPSAGKSCLPTVELTPQPRHAKTRPSQEAQDHPPSRSRDVSFPSPPRWSGKGLPPSEPSGPMGHPSAGKLLNRNPEGLSLSLARSRADPRQP